MSDQSSTYQTILDTATVLMRRCGYNAFSYADIAEQVGIRKASIHYHFPAKGDLARVAVSRYRAWANHTIANWQNEMPDALHQLERYIAFYSEEVDGTPRMCLCALLAAELPTLPEAVRAEVEGFFADQIAWLSAVLDAGCRAGTLCVVGSVEEAAQAILAGFEGAMIAARVYGDAARFRTIAEALIRPYRATGA